MEVQQHACTARRRGHCQTHPSIHTATAAADITADGPAYTHTHTHTSLSLSLSLSLSHTHTHTPGFATRGSRRAHPGRRRCRS
eukprot:2870718-Rhodomonas_salina.2